VSSIKILLLFVLISSSFYGQKSKEVFYIENETLKCIADSPNKLENGFCHCFDKNDVLRQRHLYKQSKLIEVIFYDEKGLKTNLIAYYDNGIIQSKGNLINKKNEGEWTFFDKDGKKEIVQNYKSGLRHGKTLFYSPSGTITNEHYFRNDTMTGVSTSFYNNGKVLSQQYVHNNMRFGISPTFDSLGNRISSDFYYNDKVIVSFSYSENHLEKSAFREWKDIEDTNQFIPYKSSYSQNMTKESSHLKNKKLEGYYFLYHDDFGPFSICGVFHKGIKQGEFIFFNREGFIIRIEKYDNGVPVSDWEIFNDQGILIEKIPFENGEIKMK